MNTAKLKVTAGCRDLLGVQKHANQHRLSRLVMEVHNDELRIIAAAVESYTDELIAALEAAEKRVAELENDEVRQRLANADHQIYMAELAKNNLRASRKAQFKKRKAAEARIAELEARTVKLPDNCEHDVMAPVASFMYEDGYEFDGEDYSALAGRVRSELETVLRRSLRAAGINLETGGE
ncbi:hypothetical protein [Cronobacter sakazakii]|uniref:hypothetical protein n=1 Tax=Cronobacter sakazakii TaxID=28141 RepID=UPI000A119445|nr:hypothetical protein [Cronobacter sakazakii]